MSYKNPRLKITVVFSRASQPMLKLKHYAFIASERKYPPGLSLTDYKNKIQYLTEAEADQLDKWNTTAAAVGYSYPEYTPSELAVYLGMKTGFMCPITPISTVFSGKMGKNYILAYYICKGYNVNHVRPVFTEEQSQLIRFETGAAIVNAGPGTGKTTTAVERAFYWKSQRVLIISYSNEAIRELHKRFKEYPGHRGQIGFKEHTKSTGEAYPIVITTVDSLAWFITGKGSISEADSSHDTAIRDCVSAVSYGQGPPFLHIIVDEAQDIDEQRGLIIRLLYATGKYKSIAIFGDPRQRISAAGQWYSDLWVSGKYTVEMQVKRAPGMVTAPPVAGPVTTMKSVSDLDDMGFLPRRVVASHSPEYISTPITIDVGKVGLRISHRFKNKRLLDIHNDLSRHREQLHVELQTPVVQEDYGQIKCVNIGEHQGEAGLSFFANFIKESYIGSKYCSPSDICIIMPSVASDNATSKKSRRLCAVFKDVGLNCYTRREGCFLPNGILITTIHSVKGKEFKVVILYCMSEFPRWFPQIPSNIADSLIYVANTRAKSEIIYLCNETFVPPRGLPAAHIQMLGGRLEKSSSVDIHLEAHPFPVTEMISSHGFTRLLDVNCYRCEVDREHTFPRIPSFNVGNERIRGVLAGMVVETLVIGKHLPVFEKISSKRYFSMSQGEYSSALRNGKICNGVWLGSDVRYGSIVLRQDSVNGIRPDEIEKLLDIVEHKTLSEFEWKDWCLLAQVYDFVCSDHMNARYDIEIPGGAFPFDAFNEVADALKTVFGHGEAEVNVSFSWSVGSCDLVFPGAVVELKATRNISPEHLIQAMVYNACLQKPRDVYVYNILSGQIVSVKSEQHILLWRYIIDVYGTIRNHIDITTWRRNKLIAAGKKLKPVPLNVYVADTEFSTAGIFDFAMVDINNPYASIVQPLYSESPFAVEWIAQHHEFWKPDQLRVLFAKAKKLPDLAEPFYKLGNVSQSLVAYYKAHEDVAIPSQYFMKAHDLNSQISKLGVQHGSSTEYSMFVKLGEIYDLLVEPLEFQKHLHQHSALTDALILYELYHLGYLE